VGGAGPGERVSGEGVGNAYLHVGHDAQREGSHVDEVGLDLVPHHFIDLQETKILACEHERGGGNDLRQCHRRCEREPSSAGSAGSAGSVCCGVGWWVW